MFLTGRNRKESENRGNCYIEYDTYLSEIIRSGSKNPFIYELLKNKQILKNKMIVFLLLRKLH